VPTSNAALQLGTDQSHPGDPARLEDLLEDEIVNRRVEVVRSPDLTFF
jgi:hypothetical protein